jgi:hypothetical protein
VTGREDFLVTIAGLDSVEKGVVGNDVDGCALA